MCGNGYARHRLWDSIDSEMRYGKMTDAEIADNWAISIEEVRDIRWAFAEARHKKRSLPGRKLETDET